MAKPLETVSCTQNLGVPSGGTHPRHTWGFLGTWVKVTGREEPDSPGQKG